MKAEKDAKRAKLEALERKLGIDPSNPSGSSEPLAGKKHRLEDSEYFNEHQEIVDKAKSAVAAGMSSSYNMLYSVPHCV